MARPAAVTAEQIRSTVLAMLAEAGDAAPASGIRFRQIVSVRKLRARLGAGDPATLARALNAIEAEVVRAGLTEIAIPDLPPDIAELMRALWQAAVAAQLDDVIRLKQAADASVAAADTARTDAELRVELLRQEVQALRATLTARDAELADLRARHGVLRDRCASLEGQADERQAALDKLAADQADRDRAHMTALEAAQHRYEALSKQLLQETAHQREALKKEHAQAVSQLKFAERRVAALEAERDRLDGDLAREREARQQAVGEALALKAINAQQHVQLADVLRDIAPKPTPAARTGLATAKRVTGGASTKRKGK
ncbi:transcriptional regulator [Burkholderia cepacia]|uniref:Transcriptional regulator n=1 Tax=Burkholderia cepacia TaxID=292 RepID=A0AAX2RR58_BURCE|nr:DNA-binding protein [Burkholderia cepacia]TES61940.1 transcriptional regulator [Burkholderia cepacia]TET01585.1 transcriptional regulator [Burkholderia cepacia]TEU47597.1 transcriptional regulator [Burkholderia cepacia]TEU53469.1 transcriptional regulator [Burkholderia cepacia]TEV02075.1 transcriptional regulator [Burkholderia cepacia]